MMGQLSSDGTVRNGKNVIGCANFDGEILNRDGFIIGQVMDKAQAYNLNGEYINNLSQYGYDSRTVIPETQILQNRLLINGKKK